MRRIPSDPDLQDMKPPGWFLLALEGRAVWELGASFFAAPVLRSAPAGDGHPVLVFPGLVMGDFSTTVLRNYIAQRGYASYAWEQGLNFGPRPGVIESCLERVQELHARHKERVSLVGWSLGGIYAREIAKQIPDHVRMVITLGTPFAGNPKANNAWRLYELASGQSIEEDMRARHLPTTPPVPTTSIYSRTDGVVAWRCSVERESSRSENIEIQSSHVGMCMNPTALYAVADRLAQSREEWKRFDAGGLKGVKKLLYRSAP
ncbi:esterase/lipase family protein [Noviherbaspirillum sp.]|uniref:esterase/lipase family protein n=1 Tax=Noviherbaspirillum sp. TaxID=1926288 RepID=UPI002B467EB5|nr:alpha/beta hydrolase [Noviherbaspirillum sp.]